MLYRYNIFMSENKNTFKKSLNLPKTSFSMRANLAQNENLSIKRWNKQNMYQRLNENAKNKDSFLFHDGPPYANGNIHIGHLLNKVLKDFVVRSQLLLNKNCPFTPGWDCHGLPIEHNVMTRLQAEKDPVFDLPISEQRVAIRKACQSYAKQFIKAQSKQMQSLLTLADYNKPYLTMSKQFESGCLSVFAQLVKEGIVYRQLKPVHWSLENKTALADAELEYQDKQDTAIYVGFNLLNEQSFKKSYPNLDNLPIRLLVWTTTPWTLPANLAIAIKPDAQYCVIKYHQAYFIVAKPLLSSLASTLGEENLESLVDIKGDALIGIEYQHPFCDRSGLVQSADFVTMEDGTGLVHIAPGHGADDYQLGLKHGLDIYCPVNEEGLYDNSVPDWLKGMHIWKANALIVDHLKQSAHCVHAMDFMHSYPHDWRSKTPVIFRSTEQWFVSVDKPLKSCNRSLRDLALDAIDSDIEFFPDWGQKRLNGMLASRPDWCISRQRSWGLPIPVFSSDKGILLTPASIKAVGKVFEQEGSDAWFSKSAEELLCFYDINNDPDAPANLNISDLSPTFDIFDVWFESGSSWFSVLASQGYQQQADLYLEGSDQHRGWFHLSLLTALGAKQQAPFKRVLTHGFIVDKNGKKMSKSGGNALAVSDLLSTYGAEVTRWWVASLKFDHDIKVDLSYFDTASDQYRKIRNTLRFLLSNLSDFSFRFHSENEIQNFINSIDSKSLDAWILNRLSELQNRCLVYFEAFNFKLAYQELSSFCQEDLSAVYCMAVKDRLYCDPVTGARRTQTLKTLLLIFTQISRLLAVFLPHTADEAFLCLFPQKDSIHYEPLHAFSCNCDSDFTPLFELREKVLKRLEQAKQEGLDNPLDVGVTINDDRFVSFQSDLADLFGVSRVSFCKSEDEIQICDLRNEPRCERSWKRDETVSLQADGHYLSKRDVDALKEIGVLS